MKEVPVTREWLDEQSRHFREKADFLQEAGMREVEIDEYFRLLFDRYGFSYLQNYKNLPSQAIEPDGWYCALVRYFIHENETTGETWQREHSRSFIVTREYERTRELIGREKCYCSPLVYIGHKRPGKNARAFFAFVIDIDGVQRKGLEFYFKAISDKRAPAPSLIVSSGSGIHLYFLLDEPLSLNSYSSPMLHYVKTALTTKLWGMCTSIQQPQYHGIFQGYRIPGTQVKKEYGIGEHVKGFVDATGDIPYYTVSMLNRYLIDNKNLSQERPLNKLQLQRLEGMVFDPTRKKTPLAEAKQLWPEWYKKRQQKVDIKSALITIGEQAANYEDGKGRWHVKRDLYDWWLRTLRETVGNKVTVGHRYHCIMALAVFAAKCDVSFDELKADALSLLDYMESLTTDPSNHFHKKDVLDALETYKESYRLFPRRLLELNTAIPMPTNKRNGRKQKVHLKIARNTQAIIHEAEGTDWRTGNGAKSKKDLVFWWRQANPLYVRGKRCAENADKSRCARECKYMGHRTVIDKDGNKKKVPAEFHLSRTTVDKWWNALPDDMSEVSGGDYLRWITNNEELSEEERNEHYANFSKGLRLGLERFHRNSKITDEILDTVKDYEERTGKRIQDYFKEWLPAKVAFMVDADMSKEDILKEILI